MGLGASTTLANIGMQGAAGVAGAKQFGATGAMRGAEVEGMAAGRGAEFSATGAMRGAEVEGAGVTAAQQFGGMGAMRGAEMTGQAAQAGERFKGMAAMSGAEFGARGEMSAAQVEAGGTAAAAGNAGAQAANIEMSSALRRGDIASAEGAGIAASLATEANVMTSMYGAQTSATAQMQFSEGLQQAQLEMQRVEAELAKEMAEWAGQQQLYGSILGGAFKIGAAAIGAM